MARENDDVEGVPKLPRGRSMKWTLPMLTRIGLTAGLLVLLLVVRKPCSDSVGKFVTDFGSNGGSGSAAALMPKPGNIGLPTGSAGSASGEGSGYEVLRSDMTEAELKAAIERARGKAGMGTGTGTGSAP